MSALVVSSDPAELAAIGASLESTGLTVELLSDLEAARRRIAEEIPELVVMDGESAMPALFELYNDLRALPGAEAVPVIFARFPGGQIEPDGADHYLGSSAGAAEVASLARQLVEPSVALGDDSDAASEESSHGAGELVEPPVSPSGEQVASVSTEQRSGVAGHSRAGRWLEIMLLAVGVVLLILGGAILLLQRDTLPPLVVPPTVVGPTPAAAPATGR